jgi:hypothetical protein
MIWQDLASHAGGSHIAVLLWHVIVLEACLKSRSFQYVGASLVRTLSE